MSNVVNVDFITKVVEIQVNDTPEESLAAQAAINAAARVAEVGQQYATAAARSASAAAGSVTQTEAIKNSMLAAYGYPFTAATAADMTDTSKIYVYVGNETGYTNGNWYYNNGSAWVSGGVYNAVAFATDKTLSIDSMAADAKTTGSIMRSMQFTKENPDLFVVGSLEQINGIDITSTTRMRTQKYISPHIVGFKVLTGYAYRILAYQQNDTYVGEWNGSAFSTSVITWFSDSNLVFFAGINKDYKYKIVVKRTDEEAIDLTTDAKNVLFVYSTDTTLSTANVPADAKTTGDMIFGVEKSIADATKLTKKLLNSSWRLMFINPYGNASTSSNTVISDNRLIHGVSQLWVSVASGWAAKVFEYSDGSQLIPTNYIGMVCDYTEGRFHLETNKDSYYIVQLMKLNESVIDLEEIDADVISMYFYTYEEKLTDYTSETEIRISDSIMITKYYIHSANRWYASSQPKAAILFSVGGSFVKFEANPNFPTIYALLDKTDEIVCSGEVSSNGTYPTFIDGEYTRHSIAAGTTETIYVPKGCILYVYNLTQSGDEYFPAKLVAYLSTDTTLTKLGCPADAHAVGVALKSIEDGTQKVFNLFSDDECTVGIRINDEGEEIVDNDYKTTPFFSIPIKYKKNLLYTHLVASDEYTGYIAFYDSKKEFIETVEVTSYVENKDEYAYFRCSLPKSSTRVVIKVSNENTTPQYKEQKLLASNRNKWFNYENNVVSDGALTERFRIAMKYVGNTEFGYGTEHTAFAEECIKTTKDTHSSSSSYEGERYQIDCSTYVGLLLLGIPPECSRYYSNKNIAAEYGYRFNELIEYEGYVYGVKQTLNTKRIYANAMAKYAYDNGFLYLVDDGFLNVRAGDVLFVCNQGASYSFYENIGHTMMVLNVIRNNNGSNAVVITEAGGANPPCTISVRESKPSNVIYGARFPLPFVQNRVREIASFGNAVTQAVSGSMGDDSLIYTATLNTPIQKGNFYTVYGKATIPENCYVTISVPGISSRDSSSREHRPDGVFCQRFEIHNNGSFTPTTSISIKVVGTDDYSGDATLNEFYVYDGYVSV